ncbi:hypothetical protein QTI66_32805 [Variovorax sp. J22R133]|uniref:hypothetical protein n=1 Tax=Variovorax brevis TaxID=3053503 RepID=UPI002575288E|nr:hypothetical protein [Variovorax sp. J22R133]MDM0116909.1 hypothetical protein [Variovorax sp. J22R133]
MMIEAVLVFGLMNIAFEFVLLSTLAPRTRLRVLGSHGACAAVHVAFLAANLAIHWGTLIGTMSAILAFISSIATVAMAQKLFGTIVGTQYTTGLIRYQRKELI